MQNLKIQSEKLYAVLDKNHQRASLWFFHKYEAQDTCDKFNEHVSPDHFICEFDVVPVVYAKSDSEGNYA